MSAFDATLLPMTGRVDSAGRASVGGVDLVELAEEFGTPLYVYDEEDMRARCREYFAEFHDGAAYASKAFLCMAMARLVAEEGLGIDVATGGELHVVLASGFPAERIVFHGNNKSDAELRHALTSGVGRIVADSFDELDRLEWIAHETGAVAPVQVRVTPGVSAQTHAFIETGNDDSKFGFSLDRGDAFRAARRVIEHSALHFAGIHCHIGSQVFAVDSFARTVEKMVDLVALIERDTGATVDELNAGGGLGVRYLSDDAPPTIGEYADVLRRTLAKALAGTDLRSRPRLMCEPGRSISAPAGLTLYRVGTVKRIEGLRTYVAVDGGMSDNLRPVTYGAKYEAFLPARTGALRPLVATIAGKHCEQGDLLVRDAQLPADVAVGDILATPVTGAYAHAMASNYNRVPRPAVVFVRDGAARVVVRRETFDDLTRLDAD